MIETRTPKPVLADSAAAKARGLSAPSPNLFVKKVKGPDHVDDIVRRPSISYWQDARMRLKKNKVAVASAVYIVALGLTALVVPEIIPYTYDEQEIWNKHSLPTLGDEALVIDGEAAIHQPVYSKSAEELNETPDPSADGSAAVEPPMTPENVHLVGEALTTGVVLQWDAVPGTEGYRIYRSITADTLGVPVDDLTPDRLSYLDNQSLAKGQQLYYFVTAFNAFGESADPKAVIVTPKLALPLDIALTLDPSATIGSHVLTNPHYLGTDYMGRDMLARVLAGARISLFIGISAPLLYIFIGIIYGCISGYFGGFVDNAMMRVADVVSTVPELLVVILLQVVLGSGVTTLVIAIVVISWARSANQIRGEVLRLREQEFVHAAKVLGTGFRKIVTRHLLPNVMGTVLVLLTLSVPSAIFTEAFLSFIGLGVQPPMASWGVVTKEGARVFLTYPHELLVPALLICGTMLAFNLLGDGLRDALDPKLRGAK